MNRAEKNLINNNPRLVLWVSIESTPPLYLWHYSIDMCLRSEKSKDDERLGTVKDGWGFTMDKVSKKCLDYLVGLGVKPEKMIMPPKLKEELLERLK